MFVTRNIQTDHKDLIHDIAYDFYGRRFATCSSDQSVKVWDLKEDDQWHCTSSWKTHSGSVWKVTWAHPEFGQVIATCSFDRSVAIWEELITDSQNGERNVSAWVKKALLVDSRTSVTDVKFSPKHLGLLLASCSSDGIIRIYEAPDIMNLSQWTVQHDINTKLTCSCIAWNPSPFHAPMLAVGSDDNTTTGGKIQIYESSENTRRWIKVETITTITDPVHDVSFAPNVGRTFHLLGVASRDVRVLSLKPSQNQQEALSLSQSAQQSFTSSGCAQQKYDVRQVAQFEDHGSQVWRVSWNITGTILASSGDDGNIRLWKPNYLDSWKSIAVIKGDGNANATISASAFASSRGLQDTERVALDGTVSSLSSNRHKNHTNVPLRKQN